MKTLKTFEKAVYTFCDSVIVHWYLKYSLFELSYSLCNCSNYVIKLLGSYNAPKRNRVLSFEADFYQCLELYRD